jgi:hypothetical protein
MKQFMPFISSFDVLPYDTHEPMKDQNALETKRIIGKTFLRLSDFRQTGAFQKRRSLVSRDYKLDSTCTQHIITVAQPPSTHTQALHDPHQLESSLRYRGSPPYVVSPT